MFRPILALFLSTAMALAADPKPTAPVKEISPGVFQIATVKVDKASRTASFEGAVQLDSGLLEYLLVTPDGPTHESLLVTETDPRDLHVAMLLLGVKTAPPAKGTAAAPEQITKEYLEHAPELKGQKILVSITYKHADSEATIPAEDWLLFGEKDEPVTEGPWLYNGSMFGPTTGDFMAKAEGVIAALVTNPSALINNPRPGHDDDKAWSVNRKRVAKAETPVRISIRVLGQ
jgi:hypothetical protein